MSSRSRLPAVPAAACLLALGALTPAGCGSSSSGPALKRSDLVDPNVCKDCHPKQFAEWSGSMHAYASEDPVFRAMNERGQRETQGALGTFCVKCHAPMAVQQGLTADGRNLADLAAPMRGVTCYFCHAAESIDATTPHNNPLLLVKDDRLFGPFADPVRATPHDALYSPLFDASRSESAAACGTCHDIVNQHGTAIERTFQEWQGTLFSDPKLGLTCAGCHMALPTSGPAPASTISLDRNRDLHDHAFPGVDVALTPFPEADAQRQKIQTLLDTTLQTTICLDTTTKKIWVILDNVGAGHAFPSGAAQDRRAWVEVTATLAGTVLYQSGVPPASQTAPSAPDADLWLVRDCIYGDDGKPVNMFWQAASFMTDLIPGSVPRVLSDPASFTKSHIKRIYPGGDTVLADVPDRIAVKVHVEAIGADVIQDLVGSLDLDPAMAGQIPTFDLGNGGTLEWTPDKAGKPFVVASTRDIISCVMSGNAKFLDTPNIAVSHAQCPQ